ncbi:MAG: Omp28 family outer membrane lipoprotein [Bacteroidia bacterium]|nr:Omp28 family outer membrane lipoprotein [Bacteroidia bacterium]MCZ2247309.1 Omp28 family outer membrane lipoprotein [Bacteroidia bacterium]
MKKLNQSIFLLLSIIGFFYSCDNVDRDVIANYGKEKNNAPADTSITDSTETRVRKVLLEDFTGHTCPNCPAAAAEIKNLENLYGDKVVAMALHVSSTFAEPMPPTFPADYRTTEGTAIDDFFKISQAGLPKGMVNRRGYQGQHILPYQQWGTEVNNIINTPLDAWISMKNSYDDNTRKVTTNLKIDFENNIDDEVKLCVFLIQDSIVSPQKDANTPGGKDLDYVHNHMLRKGLTSAFGETIFTNPKSDTPEIEKSYSLVLLPEWIPEHCKIVAYLYKASNYEVIQAQEKKVK